MIRSNLPIFRSKIKAAPFKELLGVLSVLLSLAVVYCYFFSPIKIDITLDHATDAVKGAEKTGEMAKAAVEEEKEAASAAMEWPKEKMDAYPGKMGERLSRFTDKFGDLKAKEDFVQLFYTEVGQPYSPNHSQLIITRPDVTTYHFDLNRKFIDSLFRGRKLRLDPTIYPGTIVLQKITIRQTGYLPLVIDTRDEFQLIKPLHDVDKIEYAAHGLIIKAQGEDPQLEMVIRPGLVGFDLLFFIRLFTGILLAGSFIYWVLHLIPGKSPFLYAPILLVFILILIGYTSSVTRLIHLDEIVHVQAGQYYEEKWLPPEICSPETRDSYSISGVSRLDNFEIAYLFAGKLAKMLSYFGVAQFQRFRYFNTLLFLILALLSLRFGEYRILTLPLLTTPQIWYLFTYFNSDAFSLFVIVVVSYQVIAKTSMTYRYLNDPEDALIRRPYRPLLIGLLFSLLLLIKVNYYIFVLFLLLVLIKRLWCKEYSSPKSVLKRIAVIALIAAVVLGVRWGIDVGVNGMNRNEKRVACRIKLSHPLYSPETPIEKRFKFKNLKDRDVSVFNLFTKFNWGWKTFLHSFGVYYVKLKASLGYYKIIMVIVLFGSVYLIFSNLKQFQIGQFSLLLIVGFCSVLLILMSLWNSWTAHFQAQGRYLFPILVMVGFLIYETLPIYNEKLINLIILLLFGLSTYSYIFIGLMQFPKL